MVQGLLLSSQLGFVVDITKHAKRVRARVRFWKGARRNRQNNHAVSLAFARSILEGGAISADSSQHNLRISP
eukprot:2976244-Amphidinium_carterae.1